MALFCRIFKGAESLVVVRTLPLTLEGVENTPVIHRKKSALNAVPSKSKGIHGLNILPHSGGSGVSCGLKIPMQIRFTHTDVTNVPDFTSYRTQSTKDPACRSSESELRRKIFAYTTMFAGSVLATTGAKYVMKTFVMPLGPTAKTLAEASTEVNLSTIPEGKNLVVKWRNKPLFIRHRTAEEVERERAVPLSDLRDPQKDEDRVQRDEWLICLGVCTHLVRSSDNYIMNVSGLRMDVRLHFIATKEFMIIRELPGFHLTGRKWHKDKIAGTYVGVCLLWCVPIAHAGEYPGGFYCPCHGSHYDASGRIRKGPAPSNLEVPSYNFVDDSTVVIG